jgi:hypothetical protein
VTHAEMLYDLQIMEAAFESDRLGTPVPFLHKREFGRFRVPNYR